MKVLRDIVTSTVVMLALGACGGGGGSGGQAGIAPSGNTIVTGIASKGPVSKGTVKIYAVNNGAKDTLLTTVSTDDNGRYAATLGNYNGPIIVEASGSYLDEATGSIKTISADNPIRAALSMAKGSVTLPVTALTELAVQNAGITLTPDTIDAANRLVSALFKVDIINTLPVAPTTAALAGATQAQKDYTLALATVSQMASTSAGASDGEKLTNSLAILANGISATGMSSDAISAIQTSLNTFVTGNSNNQTGITSTAAISLVNAGSLSKSYKLVLQGKIPSGAARGIQFDLLPPPGVTLNLNSTNASVLSSSLYLSADASSAGVLAAKYSASGNVTIGIISSADITAGEFATLTCNIARGMDIPPAVLFFVTNLKVYDINLKAVPGVTVTVN